MPPNRRWICPTDLISLICAACSAELPQLRLRTMYRICSVLFSEARSSPRTTAAAFLERFWAAASLHSRCSSRSPRTMAEAFSERFWAAASRYSRCSSRSLRTTAACWGRFWAAASLHSRCSSRIRQRTFWVPFLAARREAGWMTEASF